VGSILLVELDPDSHDAFDVLSRTDHDVVTTSNLGEAFACLGEGGIDVVVVEAYDPRIGVGELARTMTTLPDMPPLVLVSGSPHAPEISARVGAAAFLARPCDANDLIASLERLTSARPVRSFEDEEPTSQLELG